MLASACSAGSSRATDPTASNPNKISQPPATSTATPPTSSNPTTPTHSKTSTTGSQQDPRGQAAKAAYLAFASASHAAERHPTDLALERALINYAVDPELATEGAHVFGFRESGIAWRGIPPTPRV